MSLGSSAEEHGADNAKMRVQLPPGVFAPEADRQGGGLQIRGGRFDSDRELESVSGASVKVAT